MATGFRYVDFDLNFQPHPITGDISIVTDEIAVIQSIKNLVQQHPYESPFEPNKGSKVTSFLFEQISTLTALSLKDEIKLLITNYEPRAEIIDISVYANLDDNGYEVTITFNVVNIPDLITIGVFLERLR